MFTMYYDARGSSQEKARFTENNITSKNFNHVTYILTRLLFQCFNFMHWDDKQNPAMTTY